jgi:hypothetical protein
MIMRDQGCEVSTVSTVLEFSAPFSTLLIRYVDRSSNYSIYRNTADLPIYQSKYHTLPLHQHLQNHTRDIQYSIVLDTQVTNLFMN